MQCLKLDLLLFLFFASGCTETTSRSVIHERPEQREVLLPPRDISVITANLEFEGRTLHGTLRYAEHCKEALVTRNQIDTVETKRPKYGTGVGAILAGSTVVIPSILVLWQFTSFAPDGGCAGRGENTASCYNGERFFAGVGGTGLLLGGGAIAAGIGTFFLRTSSRTTQSELSEPTSIRVIKDRVPCDTEAVSGLDIVLKQGAEVLQKTTCDERGKFDFVIPNDVNGTLSIYVDDAESGTHFIKPGSGIISFGMRADAPNVNSNESFEPTRPVGPAM
jgi:hypothetical protein